MTYTWVRRGRRTRMPYENPQGRRVHALAALLKDGHAPALYWVTKSGSFRAEHLIRFLTELPTAPVPTVVVLDNASIHRSRDVQAARPALWARGIYLYFLPAYSPERNEIEPIFRVIKHHQMPARRYPSVPTLIDAVDTAVAAYEQQVIANHAHYPRTAA